MYLNSIQIFYVLITIICYCKSDCGCNLNRKKPGDNQCPMSKNYDPIKKYSREYNEIKDNNKVNPPFDIKDMVLIEGATFEMGTNKPVFASDHEGPVRNVTVSSFHLDKYEVSNQHFYDFIKETGYKTEAEVFGDSFVFEMSLPEKERNMYQDIRAVQAPWWIKMKKVTWKHPEGESSTIEGKHFSFSFIPSFEIIFRQNEPSCYSCILE